MWFIVLYMTAGYLRKHYKPNGKKAKYLTVYLLIAVILTVSIFVLRGTSNILASVISYEYNTILVYLSAVSLFLVFLNSNIKNNVLKKVIAFVGPLTLGVYLIHEAPSVKAVLWPSITKESLFDQYMIFIFFALIIILAIFVICLAIEFIRQKLFKLLRINTLICKVSDKIETAVKKRLAD